MGTSRATSMDPPAAQQPGLWQRFVGRWRNGLLLQELLDRLATLGIVVYPYFVVLETAAPGDASDGELQYPVRRLGAADLGQVTAHERRQVNGADLPQRLATSDGFGIFVDGALAGYSWISYERVPVPASGGTALMPLLPAQAYLFDMYIAPQHRGLRLAPLLRRRILRELAAAGRPSCYSLSLAGNRSTRRFKARLGAREVELRIYLHLRLGSLPGFDLRLWRRGEHTTAPRLKWVRATTSRSTAHAHAHAHAHAPAPAPERDGGGTSGARHDV